MRIVAGRLRGRRLAAPSGMSIRPTSDRTRESVFNILSARLEFEGARVIDLFAGTGALGIEALSRGASFALFVDDSTEGRALIRANVETLGLQGVTKIFRRDATDLGRPGTMPPFDLAFADPPYGRSLGEKAASGLLDGGWLKPDALLVLEERTDSAPAQLAGFETLDRRAFGETTVGFFRPLAGM
jgi:16S rRNA (guanine966-N2)-methyltransferase